MPSFSYLSDSEARLLVGYLQQLAGVAGADNKRAAIQESHARVGELIVKSTCHICHSAMGLNPTPTEFLDGAIPPLSVLTHRVNRADLVRKVTAGAPIVTDTMTNRGRMPVFNYLSVDEAADVYDYLAEYPPVDAVQIAQAQPAVLAAGDSSALTGLEAKTSPTEALQVPSQSKRSNPMVLPVAAEVFVVALLVLGFCFTVYECKRISRESQTRRASVCPVIAQAAWDTSRLRVQMVRTVPILPPESLEREFGDWWDERRIS
jgi:mono/diheme cytochrome c family protein